VVPDRGRDGGRVDTPSEPLGEPGRGRGHVEERPEPVSMNLPPTPISSTSSFLQRAIPSAGNGQTETDPTLHPATQALKNFVLYPTSLKSRRHASLPVSSIDLGSVLAAHISNPGGTFRQTAPGSPTIPNVVEHDDRLLKFSSISKLRKLTSGATTGSCTKNTPPLTPRALSQEDGYGLQGKKSPLANTTLTADVEQPANGETITRRTDSPCRDSHALPTDAPKGKLYVKIEEARGLKPSYDPYVVCVFEWNEYISKGPRHDAMDIDHEVAPRRRSVKDAFAAVPTAVPVRRTDSDMGKPMAIPMKSRQSSNNSEMENAQQLAPSSHVTSPQWDHEATL
jgi:serine/threonine protein kinase SCH9